LYVTDGLWYGEAHLQGRLLKERERMQEEEEEEGSSIEGGRGVVEGSR